MRWKPRGSAGALDTLETIKPQDSAWVISARRPTPSPRTRMATMKGKVVNIILTHHDRQNGNSGMVSAAECQIDGQDKQDFMIMVPLDMQIRPISGSWR